MVNEGMIKRNNDITQENAFALVWMFVSSDTHVETPCSKSCFDGV